MAAPRRTTAEEPDPRKAPARKAPAKKAATKKAATKRPAADRPAPKRAPIRDVVLRSAGELADLIGQQPEGVVAVEQDGDGAWKVQVEVVESHRIPETTDILAVYELVADSNGELLSYRRLNRYVRGQMEG
ncbi:gas vesicle protein [Kribbella sp.]|uniref:gas vesicle protein GvpO n=1 Tax=Kribbella sp. TaxID=1871183 RepID=UPI002D331BB2|nr:gas vesicle protein [Kribbella sp.]HZX05778.1 gas vesicle protein [Kribbella sp.]